MRTGIIIPSYNEGANIGRILEEIQGYKIDADIIVINDGSRDSTASIASTLGAIVISHPVNLGYGAAVQTGLKYASKNKYSRVILFDADGQHDPSFIKPMLDAGEQANADIVIGSRFKGAEYHISFVRKIGLGFFKMIVLLISHHTFSDITSGFKILNERATAFLSKNFPADFPDAQILISLLLNGFKVIEVPSVFRTRTEGKSMFSLSKKLYYPFKIGLAIVTVLLCHLLQKKQE